MWKIYVVISDYSKQAIELLKKIPSEITIREPEERPSEEELCDLVKGYDILIIGAKERMTSKVYTNVVKLKILGTLSIGVDHIDRRFFEDKNIEVINCPNSNVVSVAEHTFALILALYKKLFEAHLSAISLKDKKGMSGFPFDVYGKTLGVIGAGKIGSKVIEIAHTYGMKILCYTFHPNNHQDLENFGVRFVSLEQLFAESDIITIHIPLTNKSSGLVSKDLIKLMKTTSILINTCRSEIINNIALAEALKDKTVFGGGIDLDIGDIKTAKRFKGLSNIILTPHTAGLTQDSILRMDTDLALYIVEKIKK